METIHGLNTNGPAIISTGIVFTVLSVVAVGLRFISKRMTRAPLGIDDWLLLASLIVYFAAEILVIRSDIIGREADSPDDFRYITYLRYVYVYSIFYFTVIALAQISILLFYRRIFLPTHLRYTSVILSVICAIVWMIAMVIEIGYPGHKISEYFPGSSSIVFNVTYLSFWLAMAIIETLIDIVILVLPIRVVFQLQLATEKKILLSFIFALGSFVVITSIVRMAVLYRPTEPDIDLTQGDIWLNVHLGTAIISACLPTYKPLISGNTRLMDIFYHKRGSYPTRDTGTLPSSRRRTHTTGSRRSIEKIYNASQTEQQGNFVDVRQSGSISMTDMESKEEGAVESGAAIHVKQTVDVV